MYVPVGDERFPRHFWGMGIRIEDCICLVDGEGEGDGEGEQGRGDRPLVLTAEAVKEIADIEALR